METGVIVRLSLAVVLALALALHGLKRKSLSISGCIAAVFVGFCTFAASYRFGILLIAFYYSSSKLTKVKEDIKAKLEEGYQSGGQRDWIQVFSCSILAVLCCAAYVLYCGEDANITLPSTSASASPDSAHLVHLPLLGAIDRNYLAFQLSCMYVAHFATANGDTWASELGVLSRSKPRLITSLFLRQVPPGTNGGMSLVGTFASAAGGAFIGLTYSLLSFFYPTTGYRYPMVLFALVCGILGSLVDSLLGATLQATYYSQDNRRILKSHASAALDSTSQRICGHDVLSNEAVNFLSIAITMGLSWILAPVFLPTTTTGTV